MDWFCQEPNVIRYKPESFYSDAGGEILSDFPEYINVLEIPEPITNCASYTNDAESIEHWYTSFNHFLTKIIFDSTEMINTSKHNILVV